MENNMNDYWTQAAENYGRIIDDELNSFRPSAWKSLILGEERCIDIYGSTFSGKDNPEEKINIELLPLSKEMRPDWDVQMLMNCGFREVDYQRDITELVWDDKERLLYGASPMFMISAVK